MCNLPFLYAYYQKYQLRGNINLEALKLFIQSLPLKLVNSYLESIFESFTKIEETVLDIQLRSVSESWRLGQWMVNESHVFVAVPSTKSTIYFSSCLEASVFILSP